jgi:CxxC motif-containing protein (DUF1111 family)
MKIRSALIAIALAAGCGQGTPTAQEQLDELAAGATEVQAAAFGDPIPGLKPAELARFSDGQTQFQNVEGIEDGLGPVFNEASCVACHGAGLANAVGGTNGRKVTRFGRYDSAGNFDPMTELGGSLVQDHAIGIMCGSTPCFTPEVVPDSATVQTKRRTPPLFGLGLLEAVPDAEIKLIAAAQSLARPGIAGAVSIVTDMRNNKPAVGKLGWKAQVPSVFQFSGDAYLNEMGITNPMFPNENCPQGKCELLVNNPRPDLNDDGTDVQKFTDFMRMLAPPPRGPINGQVREGQGQAQAIGCLDCHVATLVTAGSDIAALSYKALHPFTDLLLHDMGSLGDGIAQGAGNGHQFRTAPLWGLRMQATMLHDGRATTFEQAIAAHDGQGAASRDKFAKLNAQQKAALLAFLGSL